jgi:14-3-3 protein
MASKSYEKALVHAEKLEPCSPLKLGIELNLSVFYYEILNETKKAISTANTTYMRIEEQLHQLQNSQSKGEEYNDAATIMQLLYENLNMWRSELQEDTGDKEAKNDD